MASSLRVTMIGGGLGGALLATYLGRAGHQVQLYERRSDPGAGNFVGGRSINLAVSVRGIHALEQVGLATEILASAIPMRGRMIHDPHGGLHYQPYDKDPTRHINSIGRAALNQVTLAAAQKLPNVAVHFDQRCVDVDLDAPGATILDTRRDSSHTTRGDLLIGVDGAYSAVRRAFQRLDRFEYAQSYLGHGYKELTIPPGPDGAFRLEKNALHIWPRRRFMMIALPNPDGSFTCTLFYPFEGPESFAELRGDDDVRRLVEAQFPDAVPLMPNLLAEFRENPVGSMVTVRCGPWQHAGRAALVGDAAHAVVPFYGQGMNATFEDVVELDECLRTFGPDWPRALREYEGRRKPNVDALADLALTNFVEMRDHTGSRTFRARKRLERTLHTFLPGLYTPLYTLVSFTRTPYARAVARARRQDRIVLVSAAALATLILALALSGVGFRRVEALALAASLMVIAASALSALVRRRAAAARVAG